MNNTAIPKDKIQHSIKNNMKYITNGGIDQNKSKPMKTPHRSGALPHLWIRAQQLMEKSQPNPQSETTTFTSIPTPSSGPQTGIRKADPKKWMGIATIVKSFLAQLITLKQLPGLFSD